MNYHEAMKKRWEDDEYRQKMIDIHKGQVAWNKGKKLKPLSEEHKKKISDGNTGKNKQPLSDEHKKKIGMRHSGKIVSPETRKKISDFNKSIGKKPPSRLGVPMSIETKNKISKANIGRKLTTEQLERLIKSHKGQKQSDETIKKRIKSGAEHYNWKGGKSFEIYPIKWNNKFKEIIRERDKYKCQICEKKQEELTGRIKKLSVHHIDYNKYNLDEKNLITLCPSCHLKTNYKRDYWIEYFKRD